LPALARPHSAALPPDVATAPLEEQIRTSLDQLYKVGVPRTSTWWEFDEATDIKALTVGPDKKLFQHVAVRFLECTHGKCPHHRYSCLFSLTAATSESDNRSAS
jgi:hypothetical protein